MSRDELTELKFVGEATAEVLAAADVGREDVAERRVSHAELVDAGVNPGVAAKIRREHSLSWSFEGGQDLDRRAAQIRGLGDEERAWVAASAGDWEETDAADASASADGSGSATAAEAAWRDRPWPGEDDASARESGDASDDASTADDASTDEVAWRTESTPTPVTDLSDVSAADADALANAGVTSVRSLATVNASRLADSLEFSASRIRRWRDAARAREDEE